MVVCLEQGADNSMIYLKLYELHRTRYFLFQIISFKSIFMFPQVIFFYCFFVEAPYLWRPLATTQFAPRLKSGPELNGEDSSCSSNKIESVCLRKCPYDHWLTNKAYLSAIAVTNIFRVLPTE